MFDMLIDMKGSTDPQNDRHDMNIIFFNVSEEPAASILRVDYTLFCPANGDSRRSYKSLNLSTKLHRVIHSFHIPLILYRCGASHVYI